VACGKPVSACAAFANDFEGGSMAAWTDNPYSEAFSAPTLVPHGRNGGNAVGISINDGGVFNLSVDACGAAGADLQKTRISAWVRFEGPPLGSPSRCVMAYLQDKILYAEEVRDFASSGKWFEISSRPSHYYDHVTFVGINCTIAGPWTGNLYIDDVTISTD
jgi:hypothetical protein